MRKLETCESLAMLRGPLLDQRSSDAGSSVSPTAAPIAVGLSVKRGRLLLLTSVVIVAVVALTINFSGRGVLIETFNRRDVSTKQQEGLLEKYNAYSGTITAAIERPIEVYAALVVQVVVLRLLTSNVLDMEQRRRVRTVVLVLGAGMMYLLANGLGAVNVQVREKPIKLVITADDLLSPTHDLAKTTTMQKTFSENQPENPVTNTILRNLILPRVAVPRMFCDGVSIMDGTDDVMYGIPQQPWMKSFLATALKPTSIKLTVAKTNSPENTVLQPEKLPMNASDAADLLVYSTFQDAWGWGASIKVFQRDRADQMATSNQTSIVVPSARLTKLLPPGKSTEQDDRAWFLKNSGPAMYNISDADFRNDSLRSWTMTFSRLDIQPGSVWVDAVTIEREMATPRLQTKTSKDGKTGYLPIARDWVQSNYVRLRKAGDEEKEVVSVYRVCTDSDGNEILMTSVIKGSPIEPSASCSHASTHSLMVVSKGGRLVADALLDNTTVGVTGLEGQGKSAVVVNIREITSITVARISWKMQNLSVLYGARCAVASGCMGLDISLGDSGQRLVVSANALPLAMASWSIGVKSLSIVYVRRLTSYEGFRAQDVPEAVGDVLLPHNIGNSTMVATPATSSCITQEQNRLNVYVNNHIYIENTLQTAYTAAGLFLFQSGVPRDVLNQSTMAQTKLAFQGNVQEVDVYVYIPSLNVAITLAGCVLLLVAVVIVIFWPQMGQGGKPDPLAHITTPHTIAKILLNETTFPPLLLTRSVVDATDADADRADNAGDFFIQELSIIRKSPPSDDGDNSNTTGSRSNEDRPTILVES